MKLSMDGRVALITGGSKGLGYAMAHKFAASGAQVCVVARNEDEVSEAANRINLETGADSLGLICDVSQADQLMSVFDS